MVKSLVSLTLTLLLLLTILVPLLIPSPVSAQDLITKTCNQTPLPQLCASTLRANRGSKNADTAGLGLIMVAAIKAKVTALLAQINKLKGSNPGLKAGLSNCAEVYSAVLKGDIPEAEQALRGNPKFAEDGVADVAIEADSCQSGFAAGKSPITAMNKNVKDLAVVARAIIRTLL